MSEVGAWSSWSRSDWPHTSATPAACRLRRWSTARCPLSARQSPVLPVRSGA